MTRGTRKRPTIVDVAKSAEVSIKTVSRVINGVSTVDPEMAARVVASVEALGFRRNGMARSLRSHESFSGIGLLIEDIANPFYSAIAAGAAEVALDHNALLLTASSEEDPQREQRLLLAMCERRVDGLLIVPTSAPHGYLKAEIAMGTPVVCLDRRASDIAGDSIVIDNERGARDAVAHLLELGHTRIGLLAEHLTISTMQHRMVGARAAVAEAGIEIDDALVATGLHEPHATAAAIGQMLALRRPPTAFFCLNNRNAIGAIQELERVGSDAQVAGFDDFETAHLMPRELTIVSYDMKEIGRRGAALLFDRLANPNAKRKHVVIPTTLVQRGRGR